MCSFFCCYRVFFYDLRFETQKPEVKKVASLVQDKFAAIMALRAQEEARLAEDFAAQSSNVDSDRESLLFSDNEGYSGGE